MNSRERVRAVLEHRMPDRIPNGLGACETTGLHVAAYDKLRQMLGVPYHPPRVDTFMTNAVFEEDVIKAMQGDMILLASPNMCKSYLRGDVASQWKEQELWGKTYSVSVKDRFVKKDDGSIVWETVGDWICPPGGFYFDPAEATDLTVSIDVPDPDAFHPRDTLSDEVLRHLEEQAKRYYEQTELSIALGESVTDLQVAPGGMIGTMILLVEQPQIMQALVEKCVDAALKQIKLLDEAVGKYVDVLSIAHDFGDNRGVTIGAPLWRQVYKPYYKKLFSGWKQRTNMHINLHSCGCIQPILGDLVECGAEIINPIQISAANMQPQDLKAQFGSDIVFWGGGYDAQQIARDAAYDEVYQMVYQTIKVLGKNGGYIFSGVHNLPADISEIHLKAMLDAWMDARDYNI